MSNVFGAAEPRAAGEPLMDERYDLKGSWVNRTSTEPKNPSVLKKDNDLVTRVHLTSRGLHRLRTQLTRDVEFLENEMRVTDYSLLLGVRKGGSVRPKATDARPSGRTCRPARRGARRGRSRPRRAPAAPLRCPTTRARLRSSRRCRRRSRPTGRRRRLRPPPPPAAPRGCPRCTRRRRWPWRRRPSPPPPRRPAARRPTPTPSLSVGCASSERSYNSSSNVRTSRSDGPRTRSDGAGPPGRRAASASAA